MTGKLPASTLPAVLVVLQDAATRAVVCDAIAPISRPVVAANTAEVEILLRQQSVGALIIEDDLPGETGIMFLARINHQHPWLRRILICEELESDLLVHLINEANVFRCAPKPIQPAAFRQMVSHALEDHLQAYALAASAAESARLRAELNSPAQWARRMGVALSVWIASLPRIFGLALVGSVWVFLLGLVVLLALYTVKTLLGIDIFEDLHLRDFFR